MNLNSKHWDILNKVDILTIVAASPRPGTDFIHSLFDSHPQIITFDGWLLFHQFYNNCLSLHGTKNLMVGFAGVVNTDKLDVANIKNFFYEFAWSHLHKFDSRYDNLEKKDQLGSERDEYNFIDIDQFVSNATTLMKGKEFSSRNALLATYGAYALTRGENLIEKTLLLHHVHLPEYVLPLAKDFPELKVIACVRDPRIYASKIKVYQEKNPLSNISIGSASALFKMTMDGIDQLENIKNISIRVNILEELHKNPMDHIKSMCKWLDISFSPALMESTWDGKLWNGDALSDGIDKTFDVGRYEISKKMWKKDMSLIDLVVINQLMEGEIEAYGYEKEYKNIIFKLLTPFLIIFPTRYELNFLKNIFKSKNYRLLYTLLKSIAFRYV